MSDIVQCAKCGQHYNEANGYHLCSTSPNETTETVMQKATRTNDAGEATDVSVNDTLIERNSRYGKFSDHATLSKVLRGTLFTAIAKNPNGAAKVTPSMEEALIMICHKLARIGNGDPSYDDSWRDIAGYAELVVKELNGEGI